MWYQSALTASTAVLLLTTSVEASSLYGKSSAVLQLDTSSYDRLITKSNHTSIVEFYAPWCGHCQKLAPAFEKAAKNLKGLAKVASVNCDEDFNKAFCGQMGVKGFPTLKIVRPSKRGGKPIIEDYQGARTAKAIVDAVVEKIPNHVKKVTDKSISAWLKDNNETAKAILFTDKGTTSALLRALAIDYLGSVNIGQIKNKEESAVETFGIEKFPTFIVLPGGDKESMVYTGEFKKDPLSAFLKQVAEPNPDPAPESKKKPLKKQNKKTKVSEGDKPVDTKIDHDTDDIKTPKKPAKAAAVIPSLDEAELQTSCLTSTSKLCTLILFPTVSENTVPATEMLQAIKSLGDVYDKHSRRQSSFPFYIVAPTNPTAQTLRDALGLKDNSALEVIAVNAKRSWWRKYSGQGYSQTEIEAWIDAIRMNEGKRSKLPESLITVAPQLDDDDDVPPTRQAIEQEKVRDEL